MMDAVKFLKTLCRMCNCECFNCEFRKRLSVFETCTAWRKTHPDEAVAIVEKWAKEHPVKTRQSEFLKHYPDAQIDSGCLNACPMDIFGDMGINCNKQTCYECKKEFWLMGCHYNAFKEGYQWMNTLNGKQCLELCRGSAAHAEALHKIGCLTV